MANQIIKVPDIGSDDPVDVIELLVGEGDTLAADDSLVVLESAKASVEVPSPLAGKVIKLLIKPGDRVNVGDDLMEVAVEGEAEGEAAAPAEAEPTVEDVPAAAEPAAETTETAADSAPAAEAAPAGGSETIKVPDIGSDDPVDVIEVLVAVGDAISADDSLVVLESAKASVEVPAPVSGKVEALLIKPGDRVSVGDDLMQVATSGGGAQPAAAAPLQEKPAPAQASKPVEQPSIVEVPKSAPAPRPEPAGQPLASAAAAHAGPAARKLARELGLDLALVKVASGRNGRITKDDVQATAKERIQQAANAPAGGAGLAPVMPEIDFSKFGEVERVATSGLRRTAAKHLQSSWQTVPQVTQNELVDVTDLEAFRKAENKRDSGQKLTMLAFVARAVVAGLKAFPNFNASLSPDFNELIMKHYVHLGFAADTDRGLMVPVLRDADKLGIKDIAKGVSELAKAARDRKLTPRDMQGGCFTISSLGGIGGTSFTPLVNSPEVGILGVSRADWQPVWQPGTNGEPGQFVPRLMLPLSLSYDHRVIDGADAARFVVFIRDALQDLRRLLF